MNLYIRQSLESVDTTTMSAFRRETRGVLWVVAQFRYLKHKGRDTVKPGNKDQSDDQFRIFRHQAVRPLLRWQVVVNQCLLMPTDSDNRVGSWIDGDRQWPPVTDEDTLTAFLVF